MFQHFKPLPLFSLKKDLFLSNIWSQVTQSQAARGDREQIFLLMPMLKQQEQNVKQFHSIIRARYN